MHFAAGILLSIVSILTPARTWYPPSQPMNLTAKSEGDCSLVLTHFDGKVIAPKTPTEFKGEKTFDLKAIWPELETAGTYVLFQQPKGKTLAEFEGTPMLIEVRADKQGQGVDVSRITPLEYAV